MQLIQTLSEKCNQQFVRSDDRRSFLLMDSLVRQQFKNKYAHPTRWSPISIIDYVENTKPCSTMTEEICEYQRYIRSKESLDFGVA